MMMSLVFLDVYTGDPELSAASAHIESRFSRLTERPGYGGMDWGARSLLMPDGARTGVLGHC